MQIEIDEQNRDKTEFTSHHGLYRFTRMPFKLKSTSVTLQRVMVTLLASMHQ